VAERMRAHVRRGDTVPLLIFPEGTCVNNEYCVMFKRGAFDMVGGGGRV
jgi:glycerol-3-phosphate O-acyltransferase 3/4